MTLIEIVAPLMGSALIGTFGYFGRRLLTSMDETKSDVAGIKIQIEKVITKFEAFEEYAKEALIHNREELETLQQVIHLKKPKR